MPKTRTHRDKDWAEMAVLCSDAVQGTVEGTDLLPGRGTGKCFTRGDPFDRRSGAGCQPHANEDDERLSA